MAAVAEQEKQKITIPEIRDYADGYAAAEAPYDAGSEAVSDTDSAAIDIDIDNMVWEVDTEPAEDDRFDGSGSARRMADSSYDSYDEIDAGTGDYYGDSDTEAYYDGRPDAYEEVPYARKMNKHVFTWVLSLVCGMYGVDRFVRGQVPLGVLKILTFGGLGFWYLADVGIAIYKSYLAPDAMEQEDLHFDHWGRYV